MKSSITVIIVLLIVGCGGTKVTHYEESRITSVAWAGDTLIAFSRNLEKGFIAGGIRRNPTQAVELWLAEIDPESGHIDTSYSLREMPETPGRIEFFPGGDRLLYAAEDGVHALELATGKREDFFTHPSITDHPKEIDVGPGEEYTAIVVDAEGMPGTESMLDLFMVETNTGYLVFHTDSLLDSRTFAWIGEDCIVYMAPDRWEPGRNKILQFGVTDCIIKPSELTEDEVRCNCPKQGISGSGRWWAGGIDGNLTVEEVGE